MTDTVSRLSRGGTIIPGVLIAEKGKRLLLDKGSKTEKFMRKDAPEKYRDIFIPGFEIGCMVGLLNPPV